MKSIQNEDIIYDYSAGSLVNIPGPEHKTFLREYRTDTYFAPSSKRTVNNSGVSKRWREDKGPIGQAIRDGKLDLLRSAIEVVKKRGLQ